MFMCFQLIFVELFYQEVCAQSAYYFLAQCYLLAEHLWLSYLLIACLLSLGMPIFPLLMLRYGGS